MRRKHTDHVKASSVDFSNVHNPLLRNSDRIQARIKAIVVTLTIVMLPIAAWIGMATHAGQQDRVAEQQYSRHQVTATSTADAVMEAPIVQSDFGTTSTTSVDATWTFRGAEHTGSVPLEAGTPAGARTDIWVDNDGVRTSQPIASSDAVAAGLFTGLGSLAAVTLLLIGIYVAVRFRLDTQRNAEWDLAIRKFMDQNSPF
ncbi:MAG: hypothetical protein WBQ44_05260 [Rhodococcus sp. (in: high G+C Gram-positive bacteria)]